MIYNSKIINIKKNNIKKKKILKKEIKILILKSLIQNNNLKPVTRANAFYKLSRLKYIYSISKQNNNLCLYSGKIKSTFNKFKMSRHFIKKFCSNNMLQNNKLINW
jgi:ribosomal protein S14